MNNRRSIEDRGACILVVQAISGVIAGALVIGGIIDGNALLTAFKTAGGVATIFIVIAMIREKTIDLAVAASSLSAVLAILSLLTASPSFVFAEAVVMSIATAVLAAGLARHDWIVGYEPFLFTLFRALPVIGIFSPILDIILLNSKKRPRERWGR